MNDKPELSKAEKTKRFGPAYDIDGQRIMRFRRQARDGLAALDKQARSEYGEAVLAAVRSRNSAWLRTGPECPPARTGQQILADIRAAARRSLAAYPDQARRARTDQQIKEAYAKAMEEKAMRLNSTTTLDDATAFMSRRSSTTLLKEAQQCSSPSRSSPSPTKRSPSRTSSAIVAKPISPSSTRSKPNVKTLSPSTSTVTKASSTTCFVPPRRCFILGCKCDADEHVADKRSAAAYKAHETRRRMKAEAEARR